MKATYTQPQIDFQAQLELLKNDGLVFGDEQKAKHLLSNISLFRLKSYLHPFRGKATKQFKPSSTFEAGYELYKFDAALRKLIWSELEKIEISVRTQLSYCLSDEYGSFWFLDAANFRSSTIHANILSNIGTELKRSDDDSILSFFRNYDNPFPPSWMTMEVTSFGSLSLLYKWLNGGKPRRTVARYYGVSDTVFESWIHSIVYVRNICGHHGRLWNRTLRIQPMLPRKTRRPFLSLPAKSQTIYYVMSITIYMLQVVNPSSTFVTRFKNLLAEYPSVNPSAMGFPKGWESEALWA